MDISNKILSDITVFMKYAKHIEEKKRRENWGELVKRNKDMHRKKYKMLNGEIDKAYKYVEEKKVLPSMRSMQFAGKPIEITGDSQTPLGSQTKIFGWRFYRRLG